MLLVYFFTAVKTIEVLYVKKLSLLLAMLLVSVLAFAVPVAVKAAPSPDVPKALTIHPSDDIPDAVAAGEVSACDVEGVLQNTEKALWPPLTKVLAQFLYPKPLKTEAIPAHYPFDSGSNILHSILTQGP